MISASDASSPATDSKLDWSTPEHGATVEWSADAHPDAWTSSHAPSTGGSKAAYQRLTDLVDQARRSPAGPIGPTNLTDGRTIATYDAAWTGITAIRSKTSSSARPARRTPCPA